MGIEAVRDERGFPRASCICDQCGREEVVPAPHEKRRGLPDAVNEGAVIKKLTQSNWGWVRKKLHCPACEARRRAYAAEKSAHKAKPNPTPRQEVTMNDTTTDLRQPTSTQRRQIIKLLEEVYDDDAKRYFGKETDQTVAETLEGGVLPGWVTALREDLFGPDGSNEEITAILDEIGALSQRADTWVDQIRKTREEVAGLKKRVEALKATLGPKARHL